jgi:Fur family ferric uptake transcriptional regulator
MIIIRLFYSTRVKSEPLSQKKHRQPMSYPTHLTRNQQAVLDVLGQQAHSVSAQELYRVLRQQRAIGLATVYRALETLKLRGLVQSRVSANGESLYSLVKQDQHYLTCLQCGRSVPLNYCPIRELEEHLQHSVSFKIYYHTLEFFGLCEPCIQSVD